MANIKDYLDWRGDISMKNARFNEVDNLIFSELAYLDVHKVLKNKKMTLGNAINSYLKTITEEELLKKFTLSQNPLPFFETLASSIRFKDLQIIDSLNISSKKEEKQFSAITIKLNYNTIYIAFRGTDNNIFGWKEDFNLSFLNTIPSQIEALNYLNRTSFKYTNIIIGGHSKGGNLAIYAAANCKKYIKKHIKIIYSNDGPGFSEEFVKSTEYLSIVDKIITIVPESSIIGMLLVHKDDYKIVKSNAQGIWQHDPLSWQVINDHFDTKEILSETTSKFNVTLNNWLNNISKTDREMFINNLFNILDNNKIYTIEDLAKIKIRHIPSLLKSFTKIDEKSRYHMLLILKDLVNEANKNLGKRNLLSSFKKVYKK